MGSIAGSGGSLFLRKGLVAAQVALSFLLLFGAGLFVRSLQNLKATDTGFRDLETSSPSSCRRRSTGTTPPRTVHFYDQLLDGIRGIPGVKSAGFAAVSLLSGDEWDSTTSVEGHKAPTAKTCRPS